MRSCLFLLPSALALTWDLDSTQFDNIVVLPDVHGDFHAASFSLHQSFTTLTGIGILYERFDQQLRSGAAEAEAPSEPLDLNGHRTLLVQLGDLIDRGPDSRLLIEFFDRFEQIIGWKCVKLIGNHELGARYGWFDHYVHPEDAASFGGILQRRAGFKGEFWDKYIDGKYGVMARLKHPTRPSSGDSLFVHAGITSKWINFMQTVDGVVKPDGDIDIDRVNQWSFGEIRENNPSSLVSLVDANWGVLATRAVGKEEACLEVERNLERLGVSRIMVGHTSSEPGRVHMNCDQRIIFADVSLSRYTSASGTQGYPISFILKLDDGEVVGVRSEIFHLNTETNNSDKEHDDEEPRRKKTRLDNTEELVV